MIGLGGSPRHLRKYLVFHGRVHVVDGDVAWASRGRTIWRGEAPFTRWQRVATLPADRMRAYASWHRLSRRLLRQGIHHLVAVSRRRLVVFAGQSIYALDVPEGRVRARHPIRGSRPLSVCGDGEHVLYGEYVWNVERAPVHIWHSADGGETWRRVWTFHSQTSGDSPDGKRGFHIHGIYRDPHDDRFWVNTGDGDADSTIWSTNDAFRTLHPVVTGSQDTRAIQLLFAERAVFYGSDSPLQRNFLFRLDRTSAAIRKLQPVGGPVFFGTTVGGRLFFSTACEPSPVNDQDLVELWESGDGEHWRRFLTLRKDRWPPHLFQYGQIHFPSVRGDGVSLWISPFATEWDQHTFRIPLTQDDTV